MTKIRVHRHNKKLVFSQYKSKKVNSGVFWYFTRDGFWLYNMSGALTFSRLLDYLFFFSADFSKNFCLLFKFGARPVNEMNKKKWKKCMVGDSKFFDQTLDQIWKKISIFSRIFLMRKLVRHKSSKKYADYRQWCDDEFCCCCKDQKVTLKFISISFMILCNGKFVMHFSMINLQTYVSL